jgi:hypothetical protein
VRDGVQHGVEVEGGQVGVLGLDEHGHGVVVHRQSNLQYGGGVRSCGRQSKQPTIRM